MGSSSVTIREVAKEAGVSISTVSRTFNLNPNVDPDFAKRVRAAARKLGYVPNSMASNLRKRSSDVISLIVGGIGEYFQSEIALGAEDIAQQEGFSVLLCNSNLEKQRERDYLQVAERQKAAGVLINVVDPNVDLSRLRANGVPIVAIDRTIGEGTTDTVVTSSYKGAYEATQHLIEQGWKRIAVCAGPKEFETSADRVDGYRRALSDAGYQPVIVEGTYDVSGGRDCAERLLSLAEPPDAIFATNESVGLGVATVLNSRGIELSRDMGLVSFDDSSWAFLVKPPLTVCLLYTSPSPRD